MLRAVRRGESCASHPRSAILLQQVATVSKSATCDRFDSDSATLQNPEDELAFPALPASIPPMHHVLITGASRGLGRAFALGFSARG
jgi:hypothetical protein